MEGAEAMTDEDAWELGKIKYRHEVRFRELVDAITITLRKDPERLGPVLEGMKTLEGDEAGKKLVLDAHRFALLAWEREANARVPEILVMLINPAIVPVIERVRDGLLTSDNYRDDGAHIRARYDEVRVRMLDNEGRVELSFIREGALQVATVCRLPVSSQPGRGCVSLCNGVLSGEIAIAKIGKEGVQ